MIGVASNQVLATSFGANRSMNVLFAWEWGAGVSHLLRFRPLAEHLRKKGHRVVVASRDLSNVHSIFGDQADAIYQSPTLTATVAAVIQSPPTIAELAWNLGYDTPGRVHGLVAAYRHILQQESIDAVVSDYGLAASIAAKTLGLRRLRIGTGFECPPETTPLTQLAHHAPSDSSSSPSKEAEVLAMINASIRHWGVNELTSFAEAIGESGKTLLATVPELDPYAVARNQLLRATPNYLGTIETGGGLAPVWPEQPGPKVIAYLKPFPALRQVLARLAAMQCNVALVADGIPSHWVHELGPRVLLQKGSVDLSMAARECSFALTNSNHGMSIRMLSLGIPVIGFPLFLEQRVHAHCMHQHRLALSIFPQTMDRVEDAVQRALSDAARKTAANFSKRYLSFLGESKQRAISDMMSMLEIA